MFSLFDLRFVLCSLDLGALTCAKDHGRFYLDYPQINEVAKSDHVNREQKTFEDGDVGKQ